MHEIAVCEAIADAIRQRAADRPPTVTSARTGSLRQVVPDSPAVTRDEFDGPVA